jgi:hypothetical protein
MTVEVSFLKICCSNKERPLQFSSKKESRDGYTGKTLNVRRHIAKQVRIMRDVIAGTRTQYDPYKLPI